MKRIVVVTGASGYTGRALVHALHKEGYKVRPVDLAPPASPYPPGVVFMHGDITNVEDVRRALTLSGPVHAVVHAAALVPYNFDRTVTREELWAVNVEGTRLLLEEARRSGVPNFLFASSSGVVLSGAEHLSGVDESHPIPKVFNDAYSESKAQAEQLVLGASSIDGIACVALRPNGIWGAGGEAHHLPKLLLSARLGASSVPFGLSGRTDFTHVDNLVHAFLLALHALETSRREEDLGNPAPGTRERVAGKAYFITDEWPVRTVEFFSPILGELGFAHPFSYTWKPAREDPSCDPASDSHRLELVPPAMGVPKWLLMAFAWLTEWFLWVMSPLLDREPFLSRADTRKLYVDNYYSCHRARDDLRYTRQRSPVSGIREVVAFYRSHGYDGTVQQPVWWWWWSILSGIGLTIAFGLNVGGMSDWASWWLIQASPTVGAWARFLGEGGQLVVGPFRYHSVVHIQWLGVMQTIAVAAVIMHVLEALCAAHLAWSGRKNVLGWVWQTFLLGFPSLQLLYQQTGIRQPWYLAWVILASLTGITLSIGVWWMRVPNHYIA